MNLIPSRLYFLAVSFFKPGLLVEMPKNSLRFRVLPNDNDINIHTNNGRHLTRISHQIDTISLDLCSHKEFSFLGNTHWYSARSENTL